MRLKELLKKDGVKIGLSGKNKDDVLNELSAFMASAHEGLNKKDVYEAISEREKKGSTGVGAGLAIPHGRSAKIADMHLVVVYDPEGKDFDAYDKKPSHLFFCAVASSDYSPHEQLEVLRVIAEMHEKTDLQKAVLKCSTAEALYNLLIQKEEEIV